MYMLVLSLFMMFTYTKINIFAFANVFMIKYVSTSYLKKNIRYTMGDYSKFIEQCSEELEIFGQKKHFTVPKISVIIPVYNLEDCIYDCLISIIKQTFNEIEIIVINDGSTDNTSSIVKVFLQYDERIKLIDKKNNGVGSARNDALRLAEGQCVIFVDGDDVLENYDVLEKVYQKYVETNVDVIMYGAYNLVNGEFRKSSYGIEKIPNKYKNKILIPEELEKCLFKVPILSVCKLYNRKFLIENEIYFQEGCVGEDQIFFIKSMLLAKSLYIIDENYYGYRRSRKNSLTFCKQKNNNSVIQNFYAIENFLKDRNFPQNLVDRILILYFEKCVSWLGKCEKSYRKKYFDDLCKLFMFTESNYPKLHTKYLKCNSNDSYIILKLKLIKYKLRRIINV